jgi:hypothetical protein
MRTVPLSVVFTFGACGFVAACSSSAKAPGETPPREGAIQLYLPNTPDDVRCLELDVMTSDRSLTILSQKFDVTPGQPATLSATGLPFEWVLLAEKAYNLPCAQVTANTPLTWFSPQAASVQILPGKVPQVSVTLHPVGNGSIGITVGFQPPPQTCSGWTCSPWSYGTGDGCNCNCGCWDPDCDASSSDGGAGDGGSVVDAGLRSTPPSGCSNWQTCVQPGVCQNVACAGWTCPLSYWGDGMCQMWCGCPDIDCASGVDGGVDSGIVDSKTADVPAADAAASCSQCVWGHTFETNNGGFTVSGNSSWQWGVPSSGPEIGNNGSARVWATNLSGNYWPGEDGYLTSPVIDLSSIAGSTVTLNWWAYAGWTSPAAGGASGQVDVSADGGLTWATVYGGTWWGWSNTRWTRQSVELESFYAVRGFRFRFHFASSSWDDTTTGWYIDDVCVAAGGRVPYFSSFESDDDGFTTQGPTSWARGVPTTDPGRARTGSKVWATNPSGNYNNNEDGYLVSPPIDLTPLAGESTIRLHWYDYLRSESGYDYASVEVSNDGGATWKIVWGPASGDIGGWNPETATVLPSAYATPQFRIRFHFTSDYMNRNLGWYIDDLSIQGTTIVACAPGESPVPDGGPPGEPVDGGVDSSVLDAGLPDDAQPGIDTSPIPDVAPPPSCADCLWSQTFESGKGGFTVTGAFTSWAWGVPTSGPGAAYSGAHLWATNLDGDYRANEDGYLVSPLIDLGAQAGHSVVVSWWQYLNGGVAALDVSKDGGNSWVSADSTTASSWSSWTRQTAIVDSSYAVQNFRLRFHFVGGQFQPTGPGWYIDDVCVSLGGLGMFAANFDTNSGSLSAAGQNSSWGVYANGWQGKVSRMWATGPGGGNYNNNEDSSLTTPILDLHPLANATKIEIRWTDWLYSEGKYDRATVEVSTNGGDSWAAIFGPRSGAVYGWTQQSVSLDPAAYATETFRLRFHFVTDSVNTYPGWYLDDVAIQGATLPVCPVVGETLTTSCACTGQGREGPVTVACGQSACGSDSNMHRCSDAGWSLSPEACPPRQPTGPCLCTGNGISGPVAVSCGETACGSDSLRYACSDTGWTWTGESCPPPSTCQCEGKGPGDVPLTIDCGNSACGSDHQVWSCTAAGWSGPGAACP